MRSMQQHYLPPAGSVEPLLRDAPWFRILLKKPSMLQLSAGNAEAALARPPDRDLP
jgi:hypothetical protein